MKNLKIERDKKKWYVPGVFFDFENGVCTMEGESSLEDCTKFYGKLNTWLEEFCDSGRNDIIFNFKLSYFNTGSSKGILDMLLTLKSFEQKGGNVNVNWYYPEDDEDGLEEAEDFKNATEVEINMIPYAG